MTQHNITRKLKPLLRVINCIYVFALAAAALFYAVSPLYSFSVLDAGGMGVFNIGPGEGAARYTYHEDKDKYIVSFDYSIEPGSIIGVWTNDYPAALDSAFANAAVVDIYIPDRGQVYEVDLALELKGPREEDVQVFPLQIEEGWNSFNKFIDWDLLGELEEAVLVVDPEVDEKVEGSLLFDIEFKEVEKVEEEVDEITIFNAAGMGVFNIGPGDGVARRSWSEEKGKDVVNFDYSIEPGSIIGVWTNDYPAALDSAFANAAVLDIYIPDRGQVYEVDLALELKGPREEDVQVFPLQIEEGWNSFNKFIDWDLLGELEEAVLVVDPEVDEKVEGSLLFDIEFKEVEKVEEEFDEITIFNAAGMGVFNIGPGDGVARRSWSEERDKDVVRFEYDIPAGSIMGVWTNDYPAALDPSFANAAVVNVKLPLPQQIYEVDLKLELKGPGEENVQVFPLQIQEGWNRFEKPINWDLLGELEEAVLVVEPVADEDVEGEVLFDLEFAEIEDVEKVEEKGIDEITIFDAAAMGVFNIGPGDGLSRRAYSEERDKDVLRFEYSVEPGSVIGVWTENYPNELNPDNASAVRAGVKVPSRDLVGRAFVKLELKGSKGMQDFPFDLDYGWTFLKNPIHWDKIGVLEEIVFVVKPQITDLMQASQFASPVGDGTDPDEKFGGVLYFDLEFGEMALMEKVEGKIAMVLLLGLLLSFLTAGFYKVFGKNYIQEGPEMENA